jgi:hypothetical protein
MMHDHHNNPGAVAATPIDANAPTRDAWEIIEEVCAQRLSGELALVTPAPTGTRVYMNNGLVYFAEHDGDETLAARLVVAGALDDEQLRRGAIRLNGVEHLGRLFERDDTVDRDAVELAIELITEMTLSDVADQPVRSFRTTMYRHHSSGINRWFSSHHTMDDEPTTGAVPVTAQAAPAAVQPRIETEIEPIVAALAAVVPSWAPEPVIAPEPTVTFAPVQEPVAVVEPEPAPIVSEHMPDPVSVLELVAAPEATFEPEPEPHTEPEPEAQIVAPAPASPPRPEPYRAALDLSDLVAAMGVGNGRSANPADDDRPVVKARMWAPSITPPEPVEPPPAVPEPFHREVDPELESLIASLVPTAPAPVAQVISPSPTVAEPEPVSPEDSSTAADDDGVEWFAMPVAETEQVTAPVVQIVPDPAVTLEPDPEPEPVLEATFELEAEPEPEAWPAFEPEAQPESFATSDASFDAEFEAEFSEQVEPETETETGFSDQLEAEPAPEPEPEPEVEATPAPSAVMEFTIESLALPTLPEFIRPSTVRLGDSSAATRGVFEPTPQVFQLDPDGPRLPGMVFPGDQPEPQPAHLDPVHTIDPMTLDSLGTLSALTPIAPITVSATPAAVVPIVSAPLATVHQIRDIAPTSFEPSPALAPAYTIPELGSIPVPEDVAAAVRRAINAIEAATTSTGPLPVTFGPLHVTSFAQQPVTSTSHVAAPISGPTQPVIQPAHSENGHVVPLMSLNAVTDAVLTTPAAPVAVATAAPLGIPLSAATMPFPEIEFPELPPAEELLSNPQAAPISNERRGALRRLIDGIRRR